MNIKTNEKKEILKFPSLNESEQLDSNQQNKQNIQIKDEDKIEDVLSSKTNQFIFDCGSYMGTIASELDTKFGLMWHAKNTTNFEDFVTSVEDFLKNTDNELTENDVKKLFSHYDKYISK